MNRASLPAARIPVLGFAAFSGTGKTTLLRRVIPALKTRGLRIAMIKHSHHPIQVDQPGDLSRQLREAGASQVLMAAPSRFALIAQRSLPGDPPLNGLLGRLDQQRLDLILVEGFKHERFSKIELHRPGRGKPLLYPDDPSVIAVATDAPLDPPSALPTLDLNDPSRIVDFIVQWMAGTPATST